MNAELLAHNIAAHWVQSGVLVVAVLVAMRLLRTADPRLRLAALQVTLAATLLLPMVQPTAPLTYAATVTVAPDPETKLFATSVTTAIETPPESAQFSAAIVVLMVVFTGIALRLVWLCGGIIRLFRFRARAREVSAPAAASDFEAMLGVMPRYVEHGDGASPATFGIFGATVLLPEKFGSFDLSTQRAIACHELLHVKRRDAAAAAVEEVLATLLWFHPWVWLLRSRIRVAREQVVDRQVIELTGNRDAYVRCLVELSGHELVPHLTTAMSSPRELRTRIDALLEEVRMSRRRAVVAALVLLGVVVLTGSVAAWAVPLRGQSDAMWSIPVTASQPFASSQYVVPGFSRAPVVSVKPGSSPAPAEQLVQGLTPIDTKFFRILIDSRGERVAASAQRQMTSIAPARKQIKTPYAEYPQDAIEKRISGTVVVDIVVNQAGDVTTGAVVSGPQELRASAFKAALGLKFEAGSGTTSIRVNVEYRLTADSWGVRVSTGGTSPELEHLRRAQEALEHLGSMKSPEPPLTGLRIGGAIRAPRKIKDVPPIYPAIAQAARVQGVVIIETRIDEDGHISDTRVVRSVPLLDQAAIEAVKQWEYTPTLLNGGAVPVVMTVTVNFTLRSQVELKILMPDGTLTLLRTTPNGGIARTEYPPMAKYGFAPFVDPDPSVNTVKVIIYELGDGGTAPLTLGNVELTPGGGVVQSATTPSFGIELAGVDR